MPEPGNLPVVRLQVTQERIDRYADLSGDYNPLHVDPAFGLQTEFGSTIAHGPVCAALFFDVIGACVGREWPTGTEIEAVFLAPVRSGDVVEATGTLKPPENGSAAAVVELTCTKQDGEVAIRGTCVVPSDANGEVIA